MLALVLAVIISVIFLFLLRCFAPCFVWVALILIICLLVALGIVFLYNGGVIGKNSLIGNAGINLPDLPSFSYYSIFGYICFGFAALILLITFCCCGRIRLAVALCIVAGQFVSSTCQILMVPLIMGALVFGLWIFSLFSMVYLIGTANFIVTGTDVFTSLESYTTPGLGFFYYTIFGTLWTNALLTAIAIFVIAYTCAVWYYQHSP